MSETEKGGGCSIHGPSEVCGHTDQNCPDKKEANERGERAEKLVAFLDRIKAKEVFKDDESKLNFIKNLSFDDFKSWLSRINGELRGKSKEESIMDGRTVTVREENATSGEGMVTHIPPHHEDKDSLLKEMFDSAKQINDPKDIALLAAACINAVHPFSDGNGRSSRLVYSLLYEGYNGTADDNQRLTKLLSNEGRKVIDANPQKIEPFVAFLLAQKEGINLNDPSTPTRLVGEHALTPDGFTEENLELNGEILSEDKKQLALILNEKHRSFLILYKYLVDSGKLKDKYIKFFKGYPESKTKDRNTINMDNLLPDLTAEDVNSIIVKAREMKKEQVRILIDIISNPEEYTMKGKTLKDIFQAMTRDPKKSLSATIN